MNTFAPIYPLKDTVGVATAPRDVAGQMWMPPQSPLEMPIQSFNASFVDDCAQDLATPSRIWIERFTSLFIAIVITVSVVFGLGGMLGADGLGLLEIVWLGLIGATFSWISITFVSAGVGLFAALRIAKTTPASIPHPMRVAVLSPIYNESPSHVFGNVSAMVSQLRALHSQHNFAFFLLSDTQDAKIATLEEQAMQRVRADMPFDIPIYYRRRVKNVDRKTGNLAHWLRHWGGGFDAMVVLDADSLMSGQGIQALTNALAADQTLGLIQTCPRLFGSDTLFGRMQQFASAAFGLLPSLGEATWSYREANYHGHNAIMRTAAFASCAGLPYLKDRKGGETLIFSHDFVEAALLRRAGWGVRMLPNLEPSYEETPTTLIDYIVRDRRWCQGNMQHLRILWSAGLHPVSRFHLGLNALTYLMSPLWLMLILIGATLGTADGNGVLALVSGQPASNYLNFAIFGSQGLWLMGLVYLMLIAPKIAGFVRVMSDQAAVASFRGRGVFTLGFVTELFITMAIAPILMIQQTRAILGIIVGRHENWAPQRRYGARYDLATSAWFHRYEAVIGGVFMGGIAFGVVSLWLLPIAISLLFAPILSVLSGIKFGQATNKTFSTPLETNVPEVVSIAQTQQSLLAKAPMVFTSVAVAAE